MLWNLEGHPHSELFGLKHVNCANLERKKRPMSVSRPRRGKHEMKIHENEEVVCCLCESMSLHRCFCAPHQINLFCQTVKSEKLHMDRFCCGPHKLTSKKKCYEIVRETTNFSKFDNVKRTTAHEPRNRVHDFMGYHKVSLGKHVILC